MLVLMLIGLTVAIGLTLTFIKTSNAFSTLLARIVGVVIVPLVVIGAVTRSLGSVPMQSLVSSGILIAMVFGVPLLAIAYFGDWLRRKIGLTGHVTVLSVAAALAVGTLIAQSR
jgi:hypothetical protein